MSWRAAWMPRFRAEGVRAAGLSTTRTRGSAALSSAAMSWVRSLLGPIDKMTSSSPGYSCSSTRRTAASRCRSSLSTGITTLTPGHSAFTASSCQAGEAGVNCLPDTP